MFSSIIPENGINLSSALICSAVSLILGIIIASAYMVRNTYTKSMIVSLCILPVIVQVIIMMVNGNLGASVAIVGAFSLVRFRSAPGSSKEISAVFLSMAVGLATGMGFIAFAVLFAIIICAAMVLLTITSFGERKIRKHALKITIPEQLDYDDVFADLLEEYTKSHSLQKVKTTNMGSLFEITYELELKNENDIKKMIDEIRIRNGNLPVICSRTNTDIAEAM